VGGEELGLQVERKKLKQRDSFVYLRGVTYRVATIPNTWRKVDES